MSGKFNTTSSSLFGKNHNRQMPDWMEGLTDNLEIKDKHIEIEVSKPKGAFASLQSVYRPENDASLRALNHNFNETKLISDAKISLAKFLSGKYYKVKNAYAGTEVVTLDIAIDGVPSQFKFPFEVKNNKLTQLATFFGNEAEYPFSKAGLEECLTDIKTNKTKAPRAVEAVNKHYLINREEIVRRFNGSLRQATDTINTFLNEGILVGAGSNTYASFHDVDQLFPQLEKQASEERMPEFHFAPNQEHVETSEFKSANALSIEASKIISNHFTDFTINQSFRDNNELLVKATVLSDNNIKHIVDFSFGIKNEKVENVRVAEINDKRMSLSQFLDYINTNNNLLEQYSKSNKTASKRIYDSVVFTRRDIKERLRKVISASKIDRVIDSWVAKNLVTQINSTTFTTKNTFEDLLSKTVVASVLTKEEVYEIEKYQRHFGDGIEFERDEKEVLEKVREASDAIISDDARLSQLEHNLTNYFKNFNVSNFKKTEAGYEATVNFVHSGVRNSIGVQINFEDSKPIVTANISSKTLTLDKLADAFEKSPVLSAYLNDSRGKLVANRTILTAESINRKLIGLVGENNVDKVVQSWLNNNLLMNIGENKFASEHSFEELLNKSNIAPISESELANRIAKQKRDRGMEVRSNHEKDTGSRQVEEKWSPERMAIHASRQIGSMFIDYEMLDVNLNEESYTVKARITNPINGLKQELKFTFAMSNGLPNDLSKISDNNRQVNASEILSLLETDDEAVKQFNEFNTVNKRSYHNIININRLENQLKTVVSEKDIINVVAALVNNNVINDIGNGQFASDYSMSEIVSYLSKHSKTDVESGREQTAQSARDDHRLDLRGQHVKDTDNRALEKKEAELSPQMKKVQNKLNQTLIIAEKTKKITSNKFKSLQELLFLSKTEKELENVSKELKKYFK